MRWYRKADGPEEKHLAVELFLVGGVLYEESGRPVGAMKFRGKDVNLGAALAALLKAKGIQNQPGQPTRIQETDRGEVPELKVGIAYVEDSGATLPGRSPGMSDPGEPPSTIREPSLRLEDVDLTVTMPSGQQVQLDAPRDLGLMVWEYWKPAL
jgi:hypothetical protein